MVTGTIARLLVQVADSELQCQSTIGMAGEFSRGLAWQMSLALYSIESETEIDYTRALSKIHRNLI